MTTTTLDYTPKRNRGIASARALDPKIAEGTATGPRRAMLENALTGLAEPFKGLSADGKIDQGLFAVAPTGVSTAPVLLAAKALLDTNPSPTEDEVKEWMMGNLCRCTGYYQIVESITKSIAKSGS